MFLDFIKTLFDFGLLILIWLVQLVIYPSFTHFDKQNLLEWHRTYTTRITLIVMPLMLGQLILHIIILITNPTAFDWVNIVLIAILWATTFCGLSLCMEQLKKGSPNGYSKA